MVGRAGFLAGSDRRAEHIIRCDGRKVAVHMVLMPEIGIRAGALRDDDVADMDVGVDGTGRADAHDVLHAVGIVQLIGINADGRNAHTGGHDGNLHALVVAGVALDAADIIDEPCLFKEILGDVLRTQRIAGHQHGLAEVLRGRLDVGSRIIHNGSPLL